MNKNLMKWLALPVMVALLGAGCGGSTTGTVGTTGGSPTAGTTGGSSRCVNAYYPLEAGSSIKYRMVSGGETIPFTIKVLEHTNDSIKLEYTFVVEGREAKLTNELVCVGGTIRGKGYFDMSAAFTGLNLRYEVIEMTGEIMPADVRVGTEWTLSNKVKVITDDTSPIGRLMNGRITSSQTTSKVVGEETVTVPAGTYRALKIAQTVTVTSEIAGRPVNSTVTNNAWYVKDVGLVKSTSGEAGGSFVMEAETVTR